MAKIYQTDQKTLVSDDFGWFLDGFGTFKRSCFGMREEKKMKSL